MLARKSTINHPMGIKLQTPLLIPSFSSKGSKTKEEKSKTKSEVNDNFNVAKEHLTDSMLVSAYDLFHQYIKLDTYPTEIVFIDSGGYETSDHHDYSEIWRHSGEIKEWDVNLLEQVLNNIPKHVPAIIVSYDHGNIRNSMKDQIQNANKLFKKYPTYLHDFLIKTETKEQNYLNIDSIIENIGLLKDFDIIGITEKEIGSSLIKRMQNIASIRLALDDYGISAPIHVFGSLDPITSLNYFISGAEIFDGLTWLRYAYREGLAIYYQNYGALELNMNTHDDFIKARMFIDNIYYLKELENQMKNFLLEEDFTMFEETSFDLKGAFDNLCGKLGRRY